MLAEQTRRVYDHTVSAPPFGLIGGGMVVAAIELSRGSVSLLWWWGMLALATYARFAHARWVVRRGAWDRDTRGLVRRFALGTAVEGLMWGVSFVLIADQSDVWTQAFMLSAMAGIAVAHLASLAPVRMLYPISVASMFSPVVCALLLRGDLNGVTLASILALLLFNLLTTSLRCHEATRSELALHFERERSHRELEVAHARIERLSLTDALTSVANRRRFEEQLAKEWARAQREERPLALAMVDIDMFKPLNDAAGHLAGDACLRRVAHRLREVVQRPGDLVARYGGEEFAVLLADTETDGAMVVGEQIRNAIEDLGIEHPHPSCNSPVTVSVGVASLRPGQTPDGPSRLIDAADRALYLAKNRGRNRVEATHETGPLRRAS